jgi:hypothetical protein
MDDTDKREAELLARLESERASRLAEKIANGEIVSVPLFIVAGSFAEARIRAEEAKANKLAELRAAGDQRAVVFDLTIVKTGVVQDGEARDPASEPSAPSFASPEDVAHGRHLPPLPSPRLPDMSNDISVPKQNEEEASVREEPVIETPICVQVRQCRDEDDPGEIAEGWFSIDGRVLTVTNQSGKYVGSRTMLKGEDARVVAKQLLREKTPESESFNRQLHYPNVGLT